MSTNWLSGIRQYNPNYLDLYYRLAITENPTATYLVGNDWVNDWTYVSGQSPTWIYQVNGQNVTDGGSEILMNIFFNGQTPTTGWPAYQAQQAELGIQAAPSDGWFADHGTQDTIFGQLSPAPTWSTSVSSCQQQFIPNLDTYWTYMTNNLHSMNPPRVFIPNGGGWLTGWDTTNYLIPDGLMNENFANEENPYNTGDWKIEMNHCLALTSYNSSNPNSGSPPNGKILLCQSYLDSPSDMKLRMWLTCNHLLIKGHWTYFIMFDQIPEWFPEYDVNLGKYSQEPPTSVDSLWNGTCYQRDFQNGSVYVNASANTITVNVGSGKSLVTASGGGLLFNGQPAGTLSATPVTSVTMQPWTGAIVLNSGVNPTNTANRVGAGP